MPQIYTLFLRIVYFMLFYFYEIYFDLLASAAGQLAFMVIKILFA